MKTFFKEEKGYALVIVLLVITLIGIIAVPMIGSVISSASQNVVTEEKNQTSKIADMGIVYFRHLGEKMGDLIINDINMKTYIDEDGNVIEPDLKPYRTDIEQFLKNESETVPDYFEAITKYRPKKIEVDDTFSFSFDDFSVKFVEEKRLYEITYTSIGEKKTDDGVKKSEKKDKIIIALGKLDENGEGGDEEEENGEDPPFKWPPKPHPCNDNPNLNGTYYSVCIDGDGKVNKSTNTIDATINGTLYVTRNLTIEGGNQGNKTGPTILKVRQRTDKLDKANLIVQGTLTINNHAEVNIENNGNAYIQSLEVFPNASFKILGNLFLFDTGSKNDIKGPICVLGTLYTKEQITHTNVTVDKDMIACPDPKKSKGFYVKEHKIIK